MRIADIKINKIDVEANILLIEDPRAIRSKDGKDNTVANAIIMDDSAQIKLSLWNDDIPKFRKGQKIRITNAYLKIFNNEPILNVGQYGKIEIIP